jgi:kynurenine formamidase
VQFEHATHEETAPRFEGGFSFQTTGFMLNDNGPTHVDSFSHLDPDPSADTIEKMPLDLFYGTAVCLDVTEFKPQTDITAEDLDRVVAAAPVEVNAGDIVLFHTATWNRYSGDKRYLTEFPGLGASASEWIVQKHQLPVPHDVQARAHHALREPREPRPGRQHALHLRRLPAEAAGRARRPHPGGRDRGLRAWSAVRPRASG